MVDIWGVLALGTVMKQARCWAFASTPTSRCDWLAELPRTLKKRLQRVMERKTLCDTPGYGTHPHHNFYRTEAKFSPSSASIRWQ